MSALQWLPYTLGLFCWGKWRHKFICCDLERTQESCRDLRAQSAVRAFRGSLVVSSSLQAFQQPVGALTKQLHLFFPFCLSAILTPKHYTCMKDHQEIQFLTEWKLLLKTTEHCFVPKCRNRGLNFALFPLCLFSFLSFSVATWKEVKLDLKREKIERRSEEE